MFVAMLNGEFLNYNAATGTYVWGDFLDPNGDAADREEGELTVLMPGWSAMDQFMIERGIDLDRKADIVKM